MRLTSSFFGASLAAICTLSACGGDDDDGPSGTSLCNKFYLSNDKVELWYDGTLILAAGVNGSTVEFSVNGGPTTTIVANATRSGTTVRIIASYTATVNGTSCSGP